MDELKNLIRPNILAMEAYSSAQSESTLLESIKLDANESPYGSLNRYPDSNHHALRSALARKKSVSKDQIMITNGSDECIDLIYRMICVPGRDSALSFKPGFGMYKTAADLNDVDFIELNLDQNYDIDYELIKAYVLKPKLKLIFICNPNNPTGNLLSRDRIIGILESFEGLVVVDEAYIDFAQSESFIGILGKYPKLLVLQTFSKSMALAGARVGMVYGHPFIISILAKMKFPYNVSKLNLKAALQQLDQLDEVREFNRHILKERSLMVCNLEKLSIVEKVFESDANFLLVKFSNATSVYEHLKLEGISVRNKHQDCDNCLRITIGLPEENRQLYLQLLKYQNAKNIIY